MGKHIILDFACSDKNMNNTKYIYKLLNGLVNIIHMKKLTEPIVKNGKPYLQGVSGIIMIETSHCSIHTFIKEKRINMDVYSCKDFNENSILDYLNRQFNSLKLLSKNILRRDDGQAI